MMRAILTMNKVKQMMAQQRKIPKPGDILEIVVPSGYAYAQYVLKDATYGYLIRVLPNIHEKQLQHVSDLAKQKERFFLFYPLRAELQDEHTILSIVANEDLPKHCRQFPLLRSAGERKNGQVLKWFLWDGKVYQKLDELKPEHYDLSIASIWNRPLLVERIVSDWKPSDLI